MSCYVASNNNRLYAALEATYGNVPGIQWQNRIPAVKLGAKQKLEQTSRRDKTGSRTFVGLPNSIRKLTGYQLHTFMTAWESGWAAPAQGPLFQAGLGGAPVTFNGGTVASTTGTTGITFAAAHGLSAGQGIAYSGEIRFVAAILNSTSIFLNAPFSNGVPTGAAIGQTVTYNVATSLGSVSIFDYWDPSDAVQRIVCGAAVDQIGIRVNGDYQEFIFAGPAKDLLDSVSFASGQGGLTQYPVEPVNGGFDYTIVPGHIGQVWMGTTESQIFSLTSAELTVANNIDLRVREFGSDYARCISAGQRSVRLNFSMFEQDDATTKGLYQAARQRSPIGVMLQLGRQQRQLMGVYMPAMVPEVPEFDDSETRLQWKFQNSRAQGTANDELYVCFG